LVGCRGIGKGNDNGSGKVGNNIDKAGDNAGKGTGGAIPRLPPFS
jgi:hypothetical protein